MGGASASLPSLSLSLSLPPWIMSMASNGSDEARTLRADANFKRKVRKRDREREAMGSEGRMGEGGTETEKEGELCLCDYAWDHLCMHGIICACILHACESKMCSLVHLCVHVCVCLCLCLCLYLCQCVCVGGGGALCLHVCT
jgi:hypothetical protein